MATTPERIECVALSEVRATCRSTLVSRRPRDRVREPGTGPNHDLACVDQVVVTRVVLRFQLPHQALTELHDTSRSAAAYMGGLFAYAETYDSSRRRTQRWITVEHAIAEPRQRRSLQGWLGRQESLRP
jgi:hypothetical protein